MPFSKLFTERIFIMEKNHIENEELVFNMVQGQIGYDFKNLDLLKQAFTRCSYTEEHGGENNEVLEFIGDKALDFAVIKLLARKFGHFSKGNSTKSFSCDYDEGKLTEFKAKMVQKKALSRRIDELKFADHLIMGKSDIVNNINKEMSVKEDLFEAIIGAVTIDCNWDFNIIHSVVEIMLEPDTFLNDKSETNYVRLIQEWQMQDGLVPFYKYKEESYTSTWYTRAYEEENIIDQRPSGYDYSRLRFNCKLKLRDSFPIFRGFGASKSEARIEACKLAYKYLKDNNYLFSIRDEIDSPNKENAINQLEILARRGYFSVPTYDFEQTYDKDGNPIWKSICHIAEEKKSFSAKSTSKKDAKKSAAFKMLQHVLNV